MLFHITNISAFKQTVKLAISFANSKNNTSSEQCIELSVEDGVLMVSATNSLTAGKFYVNLEGGEYTNGSCLIHHTKLTALLNKVVGKINYLKVYVENNMLCFALLNLGSISECLWSQTNASISRSKFLSETSYTVLAEDNNILAPYLLKLSSIAKSFDSSTINLKGTTDELSISGKFGSTGTHLYLSKLSSVGTISVSLPAHVFTNALSYLGNNLCLGYNSSNKWICFCSDKGIVSYSSLKTITSVDRTFDGIKNKLEVGGSVVVSRLELDTAIDFHADGNYISLEGNTEGKLCIYSNTSKDPATLKITAGNSSSFVPVKVDLCCLKYALSLTDNTCIGILLEQRITYLADTTIVILLISSPDSADIDTTAILYTLIE